MRNSATQQNIPKGWQVKRLIDLGQLIMGQSPKGKSYNKEGLGMPLLNGAIDLTARGIHVSQYTTEPTRKAQRGDLLFCIRATIGNLSEANSEYCLGRGIAGLRVNDKFDKKFVSNILENLFDLMRERSQGGVIKGLTKNDLESLVVMAPTNKYEQQKIASILEAIDDEIKKTTEIVIAAEALKIGLMQKLFTEGIGHNDFRNSELGKIPAEWEVYKLNKVARVERGKFSHRPRNDPRFYNGTIPFIQTGDVVNSTGRIERFNQTLNENGLTVSRKFPKGTIVLTIAANIGYTGILTFDSCFPDSLVGITVNSDMNNIFMEYYLRTKKTYLNSIATQSAQKNINLQKLEPMLVIKPKIAEQKKIAAILLAIDEKITINEKLKEELIILKKGLVQDLLSGKKRTV